MVTLRTKCTFRNFIDFAFTKFDASRTRNLSSLYDPHTLGPTGEIGGQGHYGLYVVGEANVL